MKRILCMTLASLMTLTAAAGCAGGAVELPFYDETGEVNNRLFYKNELTHQGADPSCIYVEEGEGAGYFYLYTTSDGMMNKGFYGWRSKNMNDWESVGIVFAPEEDALCRDYYWAPEVIYNERDGLYYLYYSARRGDYVMKPTGDIEYLTMGVAYSRSPAGPFVQWEGVNALGEIMTVRDELMNFQAHLGTDYHWCTIDASPFIDDDGQLYLYFSQSHPTDGSKTGLYGVKMLDAVTPDYSTVKQLTRAGFTDLTNFVSADFETGSSVNEAPFMLRHGDKYYLTYSCYGYTDPRYRVCMAVADAPLGDFVKPQGEFGNPILGKETYFDHMSGTGHHCFVEAGEQLYIVYHAHAGRGYAEQSDRSIAFDEALFLSDTALGYDVLHVNGPTYSVQPLPAVFSGYAKDMSGAKVTLTNVVSGGAELLTDGAVTIHPYDLGREVRVDGSTVVTIEFETPKTIAAVMVYNSAEISYAFDKIDRIDLYVDGASLPSGSPYRGIGVLRAENVAFPPDCFMEDIFIRPGGAAICEFNEVPVRKVVIEISSKFFKEADDATIALSEIAVLARRS